MIESDGMDKQSLLKEIETGLQKIFQNFVKLKIFFFS